LSLKPGLRYVQIAFNGSIRQVRRILPQIRFDERIIIEAGTPFIKREGMAGVRLIRRMWRGIVLADLKITDGAREEVFFAVNAGANAITVMGSSPIETLDLFCETCTRLNAYSQLDMLGVVNPLRKIMQMKVPPDFVVIHKGRDEESNTRNIIRYKDISKVRSKFDTKISVAGGLTLDKVRSAYFNGADVAILNIVSSSDSNEGLLESSNFRQLIPMILSEVGM